MSTDHKFMTEAIRLAGEGMDRNAGGPFGAVVVKDGEIIGRGYNSVIERKDPTAHAEMIAIREACRRLDSFQLHGCVIYTTCEPCPMCLGAIYWARPRRIVYACTRRDAAAAGFDDEFLYRELTLPPDKRRIRTEQVLREQALATFRAWEDKEDKVRY